MAGSNNSARRILLDLRPAVSGSRVSGIPSAPRGLPGLGEVPGGTRCIIGATPEPRVRYSLKRHPIPIKAQFQHCLVLAYAMPEDVLAPLLAPGMVLDTYAGQGFLVLAVVKTRGLRPAFLPHWLGQSHFISGYRIFATQETPEGERRRGLRMIQDQADRRVMGFGGKVLAHFDYRRAQVRCEVVGDNLQVEIGSRGGPADLEVVADLSSRPAPVPTGSPFQSYADAKRFAGSLPWAFDYEKRSQTLIHVEGERSDWKPEPVSVEVRQHAILEAPPFAGKPHALAAAFYIHDIDYQSDPSVHAARNHPGDAGV